MAVIADCIVVNKVIAAFVSAACYCLFPVATVFVQPPVAIFCCCRLIVAAVVATIWLFPFMCYALAVAVDVTADYVVAHMFITDCKG